MTTAENRQTLLAYENRIQEYIDGTPQQVSGGLQNWIDAATTGLPPDARIVELGSAFGRDAAYIAAKGFAVECTDAAQSFVSHLQDKGYNARMFNAITDTFQHSYDLIYAHAVLLHFTRQDFSFVLRKMFLSLNSGGRFAFSLKRGEGEKWSREKLDAPRFFCYWEQPEVEAQLTAAGFASWAIDDDSSGHSNAQWLHVIAYKA